MKNQVIGRILMAAVIMFGVETTASAQFGGLLKKAKQAVKEKVQSDNSSSSSSDNSSYSGSAIKNARGEKAGQETYAKEQMKKEAEAKAQPAASKNDGGIAITHLKTNKEMGRYYPAEKKYVSARGLVYLFADDGSVTFGDDGTSAGKVSDKGFSSRGLSKIDYNAAKNWYEFKGKYFGMVSDKNGGTCASLMGENWMQASQPIDHKIMAFCTYGTSYNDETLGSMIGGFKAQEIAESKRQADLMDPRPGDAMDRDWLENSSKRHELRSGDIWEDKLGEVHFNTRPVATWEEERENGWLADRQMRWIGSYRNGSIYGRARGLLGSIRANGDAVNAAGVKVGSLKNGVLYDKKGKKVGIAKGEDPKLCACFAFFMFGKL